MDKDKILSTLKVVVLFIPTMIGAFFVLLAAKLIGKDVDWSK